jgi:thiamine pyrophosphate-dependent acetolactate synthase large subunit-like protein
VPDNTTLNRARIAKFGYLVFFMSVGALALWQKRRFKTQLEKGAIQSVSLQQEVYGGKLFGQVFLNHGVKSVFTLTGGHIAPILVGSKAVGIKVVDVRHEATAVFAADATARITGVPGVAIVTAGPGLTNTITAVKNAQMGQIPVVIIGGATSDLLKNRGSLQDIDQMALMRPHVKWTTHIRRVTDIVPALERAFAIARSDTPGPVFVEVPLDVLYPEKYCREFYTKSMPKGSSFQAMLVRYFIRRHVDQLFYGSHEITYHKPSEIEYPVASVNQLNRVYAKLKAAHRPVLVIGSQAMLLPNKSADLVAAVNKLNIPVYLSSMARGLLGRESKLHMRQARTQALRTADFVLFCGVVCDFRLNYGQDINRKAFYVSVNRDPIDLRKNKEPDCAVLGDPALFLISLSKMDTSIASNWQAWADELRTQSNNKEQEIASKMTLDTGLVNPLQLCQEIDRAIGDNAILVGDGGDFIATAAQIIKPRGPGTWHDPGPFGTLGVGAGFALAAALAKPEQRVWALMGDGALGYSLIEFDTFVRHKIPLIFVVGNDACWMQMYRGQVDVFKDDVACTLNYSDYHRSVESFGAHGIVVTKNEDIARALEEAKHVADQGRPVLVNVHIGRTDFRKDSMSM